MEPPPSIITMASTMLIMWALATLAVPLVVFTMHTLSYKSGIVLAALVTVINVICISKMTWAVTVRLGLWSAATRALRKHGLGKLIKNGGRVYSSREIYPMVSTMHSGYRLMRYEGNMGEEINAKVRGD
jgi:hypothetical protein